MLRAIPSAAVAFEKFGISTGQGEGKSLQEVCMCHGIALEEFLRAMDEIDWDEESVRYHLVDGNGKTTHQAS